MQVVMLDCYFELLTKDGNYFCKGNTPLKELERTLWAHPNAEVITYNGGTHEILIDKQPLSNICKAWNGQNSKLINVGVKK